MGERVKMKMDISAEGDMTPMIDMTFQLIAFFMVRSTTRAFILASAFTMGAMGGFFLGVLGGSWLLNVHPDQTGSLVLLFTFAGASAVAGGVIALWLLGKISGNPPWRRNGSP